MDVVWSGFRVEWKPAGWGRCCEEWTLGTVEARWSGQSLDTKWSGRLADCLPGGVDAVGNGRRMEWKLIGVDCEPPMALRLLVEQVERENPQFCMQ